MTDPARIIPQRMMRADRFTVYIDIEKINIKNSLTNGNIYITIIM